MITILSVGIVTRTLAHDCRAGPASPRLITSAARYTRTFEIRCSEAARQESVSARRSDRAAVIAADPQKSSGQRWPV